MNNLSSYQGLVDATIRASDRNLPVFTVPLSFVTTDIDHTVVEMVEITVSVFILRS